MSNQSSPFRPLRLAVLRSTLVLLVLLVLAMQTPLTWPLWLTSRMVFQQDFWLLLAIFGIWLVAARFPIRRNLPPIGASRWAVASLAAGLIAVCYAGHYLVLHGFDLSRDEQMVHFDAWIFAHGALVWPIPPEWQREAGALNLLFMLPVNQPAAWVSAYLPGNAVLHALVGTLVDPAWTTPLLTGLSLPLLWSIGGKLWPGEREVATIPLILLALSGQVLLNGMTTYAMAAHLFFNLAWLRLFLSDRRSTDLAALTIGFVATGLHQPLFHPLFAGPFLLLLLVERRWTRLALFTSGYLAIGLFWLSWPGWMYDLVFGPLSAETFGGTDFVARLRASLTLKTDNLILLGANVLRLFTWQHAALLPLVLLAWPTVRRGGIAAALALGLVLPMIVLTLILPWQGNGFGYRYVHPVLGNALLLAGYGWLNLGAARAQLRTAFAMASAASLLVLLPSWLSLAHARYAPYAKANATIAGSGADYAVLDRERGLAYGTMVVNRPDLGNRPLRLATDTIRDPVALAKRICRPGVTVALATDAFFRPGAAYFAAQSPDTATARLPALRAPYEAAGCRIVLLR